MAALRNLILGLLRRTGVTNVAADLCRYSWKATSPLVLLGLVRIKLKDPETSLT